MDQGEVISGTTRMLNSTDNAAFLEHYVVYANWIGKAGITPPQSDIGVNELALPGLPVEVEVVAAD